VIAIFGVGIGIWIYLDDVHNRGSTLEGSNHVRVLIELVDTPEISKDFHRILASKITPPSHGETPYTEHGTPQSH
jgi:hypothetical protein